MNEKEQKFATQQFFLGQKAKATLWQGKIRENFAALVNHLDITLFVFQVMDKCHKKEKAVFPPFLLDSRESLIKGLREGRKE